MKTILLGKFIMYRCVLISVKMAHNFSRYDNPKYRHEYKPKYFDGAPLPELFELSRFFHTNFYNIKKLYEKSVRNLQE